MIADFIAPGDARWLGVLERIPHDVYHLPEYAEFSARHEGGTPCAFYVKSSRRELLIPLLIRPLPAEIGPPSDWKDATSPYGYPGPIATPPYDRDWIQQSVNTFHQLAKENRILTAFLRLHPLRGIPHEVMMAAGSTVLHGDVVYIDLTRTADEIWADTCTNHRRNIKRMLEAGFSETIDDWSSYSSFAALYRATMERVSASPFYFFSDAYFRDLREMLPAHLHLSTIRAPHGEIAAAGLFTLTNGLVEYHLSGTAAAFRHHAPSKLMLDAVRRWAKTTDAVLMNFGGGIGGRGNALFEFKAGFSGSRAAFHTVRMIFDAPLYAALTWNGNERRSSPRCDTGFFPVYREPPSSQVSASAETQVRPNG
jgi:hypothetical protein